MDLEIGITAVRDALLADRRISAALLFGSAARGAARASSDLDIAVLEKHGVVSAALAARLARAAGLRNLIVHRYGDVVAAKLVESIAAGLGDLDEFAAAIRRRAGLGSP